MEWARTRGANVTMANPPTHGPERKNPDGSAVRGGILTAWDPATQKERWFAFGGGQTGGGTLSLASNIVIQTLNNGHMKAFTADKGELLMDITLPLPTGVGAPMTFMLDGKQYIAVLAGSGARRRRPWRSTARCRQSGDHGRRRRARCCSCGGARASAGWSPAWRCSRQRSSLRLRRAGAAPAANTNPKMFVYSIPN